MIAAGNTDGFWIASKPPVVINVADGKTKMYQVQPTAQHTFSRAFPWAPNFRIIQAGPVNHAVVLQKRSCMVYELYMAKFSNNVLSAYSGAAWSLNRAFDPLPANTPSAMGSGLSIYGGLIRWEEIAAGHIDHALNWSAPVGTTTQWNFVLPASDTDRIPFNGSTFYRLPFGAHLRLHASFDISKFGPQSRTIAQAMKTYGIYLADTGGTNQLYNALALDGSNHWNAADLDLLQNIHISDFDVLKIGKVQTVTR
jgi:hypothetical protein